MFYSSHLMDIRHSTAERSLPARRVRESYIYTAERVYIICRTIPGAL